MSKAKTFIFGSSIAEHINMQLDGKVSTPEDRTSYEKRVEAYAMIDGTREGAQAVADEYEEKYGKKVYHRTLEGNLSYFSYNKYV